MQVATSIRAPIPAFKAQGKKGCDRKGRGAAGWRGGGRRRGGLTPTGMGRAIKQVAAHRACIPFPLVPRSLNREGTCDVQRGAALQAGEKRRGGKVGLCGAGLALHHRPKGMF